MEFPPLGPWEAVIIAMKGLPCTGKSKIAMRIGEWARCQVFSIDDFLSTVTMCLEKGYSSELMPSEEEAERLHRLAFDALCKSALRYLYNSRSRVVIKSCLFSTFELDCLLQLSRDIRRNFEGSTIIIIECHVKNEHRLCNRLEHRADGEKGWYKVRTRLDFEKARDDWIYNSQRRNWDLVLSNLIKADEKCPRRVIRLVLDPFDDLNLHTWFNISELTPHFRDAISYLLTEQYSYRAEKDILRDRYEVVQFHELRHYLLEKELLMARQKSKYLSATTKGAKCCVFKTYTVDVQGNNNDDDYKCGVCEERVVSEGYTCYFCILTLHKSCAEHQGVKLLDFTVNLKLIHYPLDCEHYLPRTYACKSCTEGEKGFSCDCKSCLFETHLKCDMFPTIINHHSHHHPLSFQLDGPSDTKCKACEIGKYVPRTYVGGYGCYVCGLYYCLTCVLNPGKVEYKHDGHEHLIELVYSRDGMEPEEDYWCSICYDDIDPQNWFYHCLDCPSYEAHPRCAMPIGYIYS